MGRKGNVDVFTLLKTLVAGTLGAIGYLYQPTPPPPQVIPVKTASMSSTIPSANHSELLYSMDFPRIDIASSSSETDLLASPSAESVTPELADVSLLYRTEIIPTPTITPTTSPTHTPTIMVKVTSTPKPTSAPTPTLKPTHTPEPTHAPSPTLEVKKTIVLPTPLNTPQPTQQKSLNPEILFQLINQHRETLKLPVLQKNDYMCSLAQERLPELPDEVAGKKYIHQGLYDRNLPYWITENMAYYPTEEISFNWWLKSSVHRHAIEGDYKYSCGACNGNICIQLFTNFTPR